MASTPTPVTAETLITLKINHLGLTKKVKLPLRDLVASSLEDKLRETLAIDPTTAYRFERYSDSAGRFVVLDRNNQAVYKQLYRAAKAKQKLKLRVIMAEPLQLVQQTVPRPVTIEDVPEGPAEPLNAAIVSTTPVAVSAGIAQVDEDRQQCPAIPGRFPSGTSLADEKRSSWANDVDAQLTATLKNMARNHELLERHIARLGASVAVMGSKADNTCAPKTPASVASSDRVPEITAAAPEATPAAADAHLPAPPQPIPVVKCTPRNPQAVWSFLDCAAGYDMKPAPTPSLQAGFSVCCNSCERTIADTHFHCSTCEEGDFDLCENCVDLGTTCYNSEHWMIKRCIKDGAIVNSTTERVPTKPKSPKRSTEKLVDTTPAKEVKAKPSTPKQTPSTQQAAACAVSVAGQSKSVASVAAQMSTLSELFTEHVPAQQMRTCNNCIQELPEAMFLHCTTCFDFDLCKECFVKNEHGHHPKHAFTPAVAGTHFENNVRRRLAPGRGQRHNAVCDGCDTFITGVRHKCMVCPDWDYCADCVVNASFVHRDHRFVPIYEPLSDVAIGSSSSRQVHVGIYCDGPLCSGPSRCTRAIVGDRYKCAICPDVDFCACCEASPANTHNKTHPLIKFRTPVRHVSVTTTGEDAQGQEMRAMGDMCPMASTSRPPRWAPSASCSINLNKVQTVVDVKPTDASCPAPAIPEKIPEQTPAPTVEPVAAEKIAATAEPSAENLDAMFQRDIIADGTVMRPNHVFEQTWVMRNTGNVAWPAGCCVRFVSGDYMGHVDPNHPAGTKELVSAYESTVSHETVAPGEEFPFTVLLRTPSRVGKAISYWRLTSPDNIKFGDRLWCDVVIKEDEEAKVEVKEEIKEEPKKAEAEEKAVEITEVAEKAADEATSKKQLEGSEMIFPKLEKESPVSSVYYTDAHSEPVKVSNASDSFEFDWADEESEGGFLTDDEYDILDASDEEFVDEKQGKAQKK